MNIPIKLLTSNSIVPTRAKKGDAAYDLYSCESVTIFRLDRALVKTGIAVAIPDGYYGRIAGRSGLAFRSGIDVLGGVIDSSYRGDIGCILFNTDNVTQFTIKPGDRIAQLIIEKYHDAEFIITDQLPESHRQEGGFGSTGK